MSLRAWMLGLLSCLALAPAIASDAFPERPIRVVIPYAPGGGTDIVFRAIAPLASASLGQQIVIENRPGGATIIGTGAVAQAAPDGYTLVASDSAFLINPGLFKAKLPYDTLEKFQGVTMMATAPVILLVHPSVPAKTLEELIALAKAKPGSLNYASGGPGTGPHLAGELLKQAAGIDVRHIPYKGTAPALTDLIGGQVQMMFGGISSARQHLESGALRAVALTGRQRNPAVPTVPTFAEKGLEVAADSYWGVYAPAGTPAPIVEKLSTHFSRALADPAVQKKLAELGYQTIGNAPAEHDRQYREMVRQWSAVIEKGRIQVE
ncbi:MAG TPA: tripartite tricarboxylate transporter substrate binding protein [Burkholderiaceae bacterium]|nr:tripartite tricarboxylate transporter substrate binding protein [Burkholderiaceae bacterium]